MQIPAQASQYNIAGPVGGAIGGGLGALTGNPILMAILTNLGAQAATELMGSFFGRTSPAEQAAGQMTGIGKELIPQLQAQARGERTAATDAQLRQLQQATTRMQQSYGASARRSGLGAPTLGGGQPTVSRAQQGRYQAAQLGAMGDIMGRSQLAAQQQLGGLYTQGFEAQRQIEAQELASRGRAVGGLVQYMTAIEQDREQREYDQVFRNALLSLLGALQSNLQPAAMTPAPTGGWPRQSSGWQGVGQAYSRYGAPR
jgi:hypothetical protein